MDILFRPIEHWPRDLTKFRVRSQFKANYNDTLYLLDGELYKLSAKNIVLQVALDESEIRLDGLPRANATPRHPGVILAFDGDESRMRRLNAARAVLDPHFGLGVAARASAGS